MESWVEGKTNQKKVNKQHWFLESSHCWQIRDKVGSVSPGLSRKSTALVLKGKLAFYLEVKVWRKSGEAQTQKMLEVQSEVFAVSDYFPHLSASDGPTCFIKSQVNTAVLLGHFREMLIFFILFFGKTLHLIQKLKVPVPASVTTRLLWLI